MTLHTAGKWLRLVNFHLIVADTTSLPHLATTIDDIDPVHAQELHQLGTSPEEAARKLGAIKKICYNGD